MHTIFLFPAPCLPSNSFFITPMPSQIHGPSVTVTHTCAHTPLPNLQSPAIVACMCMHLELDSLLGGLPLEKMSFSSLSSC